MKKLIVSILLLTTGYAGFTQQNVNQSSDAVAKSNSQTKIHRIVFQLTTDDSLSHKALMKQLNNILSVAPDTKIEVVCHGPGLSMLVTGKTIVQDKILVMKKKSVEFLACEFSMSERKVPKEQIIPEAGFVKAGIIEIVSRQEEGWSYIKSGF